MSTAEFEALLADLGWLRTLARQLARDAEVAEDLVQDACAIALRQPSPPAQWRAWLTEVLRNLLRSHRRRAARAQRLLEQAEVATEPDPATTLQRVETQQRLVAAVMQLDEPYRGTVLLRFFDRLPPRRIAERLTIPVATVHSRLQRALQQLRERLDREFGARPAWLAAFAAFEAPPLAGPSPAVAPATKPALVALVMTIAAGVLWWQLRAPAPAPTSGTAAAGPIASLDAPPPAHQPQPPDRVAAAVTAVAAPPVQQNHPLRGLVCDLQGAPIANVRIAAMLGASRAECERRRHQVELGRSDANGQFVGELGERAALIAAVDEQQETVLLAHWTAATELQPVIVMAPAILVAGRVVDAHGRPLDSGQVELDLPDDMLARLSMRLDHTMQSHWQTTIAGDGRFELGRVPRVPGARLRITSLGHAMAHRAAPEHDHTDLLLTLDDADYRGELLRGQVVHDDGRPAAAARVAFGVTSCTTDERGAFALPLGRAGAPTDLVAALPGCMPARLPPPERAAELAASWPADLRLQLGPATDSVRGRVVKPDGSPVAGAEVWLADPTPFGADGARVVRLEFFLAGAPRWSSSQPEPLLEPELVESPQSAQLARTKWSHEVQPTVTWHFVTTDADGHFTLTGLLPRAYRLRAFDPATGCFASAAAVSAGADPELVLATDEILPRLRGHVRSRRGDPIPDVQIQQKFVPFVAEAPIAGGSYRWLFLREGKATTTDAAGAFELQDVGQSDTYLHLEGDRILPKPVPASELAADRDITFTAELRCAIEVALLDADEADRVRGEDANGKPAMLVQSHRNATSFLGSVPLHNGRSGTFFVGESAVRLVLQRGDRTVRTIVIQPDPARTTSVQ
ncbi:MAG: sigma-70 family RNA polymerase sigma factor [Planctomycetes bacterium]|nr:sigma-70 family RNA polymerase sigma factor [Planctomycetota bacterium]